MSPAAVLDRRRAHLDELHRLKHHRDHWRSREAELEDDIAKHTAIAYDPAAAWLAGAERGEVRTRNDDVYKPSSLRSYPAGAARPRPPRTRPLQALGRPPPRRAGARRPLARRRPRPEHDQEHARPAARHLPAMYAGLRRGELRALRAGDVDLERDVINVGGRCAAMSSPSTRPPTSSSALEGQARPHRRPGRGAGAARCPTRRPRLGRRRGRDRPEALRRHPHRPDPERAPRRPGGAQARQRPPRRRPALRPHGERGVRAHHRPLAGAQGLAGRRARADQPP